MAATPQTFLSNVPERNRRKTGARFSTKIAYTTPVSLLYQGERVSPHGISHNGLRGGWGAGVTNQKNKLNMAPIPTQNPKIKNTKKRILSVSSDINSSDNEQNTSKISQITEWKQYNNSPVFLIMETLEKNDINKISPFTMEKIFSEKLKPTTIKRLQNNTFLIELKQRAQAEEILKWETFSNIKIKTYLHPHLNSSKGVIKCNELTHCSIEEIATNLLSQGVTEVKRISIKRNGETILTNTYILSFNSVNTPKEIKIGYLKVNIEKYIPNPLRCYNCQQYGHHQTKCTKPPVCIRCGENSQHSDCKKDQKCANCYKEHSADFKGCEIWKREKEITRIKHTKNITFPEARKMMNTSYSEITKKPESNTKNQKCQMCMNNPPRIKPEELSQLIKEMKNLMQEIKMLIINSTTEKIQSTKESMIKDQKPETKLNKEKEKTYQKKTTLTNKPNETTQSSPSKPKTKEKSNDRPRSGSQSNDKPRSRTQSSSRRGNKTETLEMEVEDRIPPDKEK